mmetsp:Transcript_31859/g.84619  ORF Transcript_31859/g.84619 Transcript_31859/m.84619 type:complete len:218 (+) Transcript_31859:553-1206(+)
MSPRHAFNRTPSKRRISSARRSSHACWFGLAQSHLGASQPSSHSRSARVMKPQPWRSSDVSSNARASLSNATGAPTAFRVSRKAAIVIVRTELPLNLRSAFEPRRRSTATLRSQSAAQLLTFTKMASSKRSSRHCFVTLQPKPRPSTFQLSANMQVSHCPSLSWTSSRFLFTSSWVASRQSAGSCASQLSFWKMSFAFTKMASSRTSSSPCFVTLQP